MSASGRAPATARSLTVPFTASSPIDPPGKRMGVTTKLSVVTAISAPATVSSALSPSAAGSGAPNAGHQQPVDQRLASPCPPAPWAIVMRASREPRPLRARPLDPVEDVLLALGDGGGLGHQTTSRSRAKRP